MGYATSTPADVFERVVAAVQDELAGGDVERRELPEIQLAHVVRRQHEGEVVRLGDVDREARRHQTVHRYGEGQRHGLARLLGRKRPALVIVDIILDRVAAVELDTEIDPGNAAAFGRGDVQGERRLHIVRRLARREGS